MTQTVYAKCIFIPWNNLDKYIARWGIEYFGYATEAAAERDGEGWNIVFHFTKKIDGIREKFFELYHKYDIENEWAPEDIWFEETIQDNHLPQEISERILMTIPEADIDFPIDKSVATYNGVFFMHERPKETVFVPITDAHKGFVAAKYHSFSVLVNKTTEDRIRRSYKTNSFDSFNEAFQNFLTYAKENAFVLLVGFRNESNRRNPIFISGQDKDIKGKIMFHYSAMLMERHNI